jgi:hypothetical protein
METQRNESSSSRWSHLTRVASARAARRFSVLRPSPSSVVAACAFALLGVQTACESDDSEPNGVSGEAGAAGSGVAGAGSAGAAGAAGPGGGGAGGQGGAGAAGQGGGGSSAGGQGGGGGQAGNGANPAAAPLVDALTKALADGDEAALRGRLGAGAFYVDAQGKAEAEGAAAAMLAGGAWALGSGVDSHHDVFRVGVTRGAVEHVLFGAIDGEGRASWLALAAPPPPDVASTSATIRAYQNAWNEPDVTARAALIAQSWSENARYVDPTADASGRAGLEATIAGFRATLPGASIPAASGALEAHGLVHFRWRLEGGGPGPLDGMDVGFVGPEGTLTLIAGFFGPLPPRR